jgi:hypothetical protein
MSGQGTGAEEKRLMADSSPLTFVYLQSSARNGTQTFVFTEKFKQIRAE